MKQQISSIDVNRRSGSSLRQILSYVFDWLIILVTTVLGVFAGSLVPNKRPFSLGNPEISFPYQINEKVSTQKLGIYALIIPAFIILAICLVLVPGPTISRSTPRSAIWHRRLWELHVGWLGLCLSLSSSIFITGIMKNLFGKPRPDLLSRCIPDLANLEKYRVGGFFGTNVVSADICQQTDPYIFEDGFRSYPSGHSSFASGGLIYLSLYLASKLAFSMPYVSTPTLAGYNKIQNSAFPGLLNLFPSKKGSDRIGFQTTNGPYNRQELLRATRSKAAAPPLYLLVFVAMPFTGSIYISSTRYSDFRHHGFDILFGYMIGIFCSVISFRFYHLPISQGAGWAWGPRSSTRSFWSGVGIGGYVGSASDWQEEIEMPLHFEGDSSDIENQQNTVSSNDKLELLPVQVRLDPIDVELLPSKNK
ncbi:putative diacylglycerol pyrophosphate phosphatase 1 [Erysiphe neolycopersici]|uniref:Putative diacylglycerol pyrophosphate phosphatase 1 n=1 Tax=Erysiphe neolycopersici TaxID=212602 RepID=A0A420I3F9_9PEZI|nr:putative diacylglycerol pyrophosphate phosphatase 1 [Erysiphe neolycopersici]